MPMIAVFVAWKQAGFFILLYLAALQNVPSELYDAAAVDGASRWRSFLNVTVPGVRPATMLVVVAGHDHRRQPVHRAVPADGRRRPGRRVDHAGAADVPARDRAGAAGRRGGDRDHPRRLRAAAVAAEPSLSSRSVPDGDRDGSHTVGVGRPTEGTAAAAGASARLRLAALFAGALLFLFPFYYMLIGSLQTEPDTGLARRAAEPGQPHAATTTAQIDGAINLGRTLINSGVFTGGVLLGTVVFGLLAGYALAVLRVPRQGRACSRAVMLILVVPFQLLTIPLYVLIVRDYGLADSYLGMILPFAINSTAVFVFRQFFLQLPRELFEAARIDGAGELTILTRIAIPLCKPALLTAVLLTFIGPWNEFLWPFLVTKEQSMQPLAVSLANYISTVSGARGEPVRGDPGRRLRAGRARGGAVRRVPAALRRHADRLGGQGMTVATFPFSLTRGRRGDVAADPARRTRPRACSTRPRGRTPDGRAAPAAAAGGRGQRLARRAGRGGR